LAWWQLGHSLSGMKASWLALRQKIVQADGHGCGSQRALAAWFGVRRGFVEPVLRRRHTTGAMAPPPHAGGRPPHGDPPTLPLGRHLVRAQPDATLAELCPQLRQQRGVRVRVATRGRVLQRLGRPRKNRPSTPPHGRRRASNPPAPATGRGSPRAISGV
jgi:transposase